jgi:hypothetical protein
MIPPHVSVTRPRSPRTGQTQRNVAKRSPNVYIAGPGDRGTRDARPHKPEPDRAPDNSLEDS